MKPLRACALILVLGACTGARTPRESFDEDVLPLLERSCAASTCHGVSADAEARGEQIDWSQLFFRLNARGRIAEPDRAYETAKRAINTVELPEFSTLLRKPLAARQGGLGHLGGACFSGPGDPSYTAVRDWIASERGGGEDPEPLSELERVFADTVQPVLVNSTCMTSHCHGQSAGAVPYRLDPGYLGQIPIAATRHNYRETLAVSSLDGYPLLSRLVRKAQPLGAGIVHKGQNFDFFAGDPGDALAAIRDWVCAERKARTGHACAGPREAPISGFVYVRGPISPGPAFELERFTPGSDLFLARVNDAGLTPVSSENLTASLHPSGPADVRDPAVSPDGTRVVFSLRSSSDHGHHIWMLDLVTREAKQLTSGNRRLPGGGLATDRDPTFGPDDSVWFVSTRAGRVADQGRLLDAEIYSLDASGGPPRRWTYTPHVERKPVFFNLGEEAGGELGFSALRDALPSQRRAHVFRFPPSLATEYHQHFGVTPLETFIYDMRELPDGRYVSVAGELTTPWEAGKLAVVDRNFGPEINAGSATGEPALKLYRAPMVVLTGDGLYRDPAPLPDGRILVAHQSGDVDASGETALVTRIELLELEESADGTGPIISSANILLDEPGVALTEPEPISIRAPVRSDAPAIAPRNDETALFRHHGLPMIDALLDNLSPSGVKTPLEGVAAVRLLESLPLEPSQRVPLPGETEATSVALGPHGPARILAELPVEADGSFQVRVPAFVPFRLQALDAAGMAIGKGHNRWFYTLPGQVLTQGISVAAGMRRYGSSCAACHGDPDGVARAPELDSPDLITGASLVLSRFERQNPRRPLDPPAAGPDTRIEIDFARDVQPVLERRCTGCHGKSEPAAALDLSAARTEHFSRSYESLLAPGEGSGSGRAYVDDGDGRARSSYLVELLLGRELDAPRELPAPGVPHPAPTTGTSSLSDRELRTLIRWIELGATFRGSAPLTPEERQ